ncbi:MAG: TrkA C-terminal domain-containing protein [Bacteroidales bacterium]
MLPKRYSGCSTRPAQQSLWNSPGILALYVQKLSENAPVLNKTIREIHFSPEYSQYRAVAIKRKEETIIPTGDEVFHEGDLVYVVSTREGIRR